MNTSEANKEILHGAIALAENVLNGRAGLAELKLYTLRILNNAQLILDEKTKRILNELADASIEHNYDRIRDIYEGLTN